MEVGSRPFDTGSTELLLLEAACRADTAADGCEADREFFPDSLQTTITVVCQELQGV